MLGTNRRELHCIYCKLSQEDNVCIVPIVFYSLYHRAPKIYIDNIEVISSYLLSCGDGLFEAVKQ